jgi:predicted neuraminidase
MTTSRRSLIQAAAAAAAAAACVAAMPVIGARSTRSFAAAAENAQAQPGLVSSEFVYETAPYPACHASTIVETKAGLVAAWFGGTRERAPDVGIWVARHEAGKWTTPVEVVSSTQSNGSQIPSWNPVLFQPSKGPLLLFYKVGPSPSTWWGMLKTSTDNGNAWSDAQRLPDRILGPIKNKPTELADGSILCPSSSEEYSEEPKWRVHFERTADLGETWTTAAPPLPASNDKPVNAIQPSILQHGGSRLQAIGRTRSARLFESWSQDDGRTWTPVSLIDLPNPNSGTDAVTLRDGRHALVYNHNETPKGRTPLNVAVSKDGKTWEAALVLESEPGEYSYPAMIQASDGLVHVTYTWKRERIKHAVIDPAKLQTRPMANGQWPGEATK